MYNICKIFHSMIICFVYICLTVEYLNGKLSLCLISLMISDRSRVWRWHWHGEVLQHQVSLLRPGAQCCGPGGHGSSPQDARRWPHCHGWCASAKGLHWRGMVCSSGYCQWLWFKPSGCLGWPHGHSWCVSASGIHWRGMQQWLLSVIVV